MLTIVSEQSVCVFVCVCMCGKFMGCWEILTLGLEQAGPSNMSQSIIISCQNGSVTQMNANKTTNCHPVLNLNEHSGCALQQRFKFKSGEWLESQGKEQVESNLHTQSWK